MDPSDTNTLYTTLLCWGHKKLFLEPALDIWQPRLGKRRGGAIRKLRGHDQRKLRAAKRDRHQLQHRLSAALRLTCCVAHTIILPPRFMRSAQWQEMTLLPRLANIITQRHQVIASCRCFSLCLRGSEGRGVLLPGACFIVYIFYELHIAGGICNPNEKDNFMALA